MTDPLSPGERSRVMSRIRSKNTRPELTVRRRLHAKGLRYRLHAPELAGRPDIVFPKYRAVVFVSGCFWHGHACPLFRVPGTRRDFWLAKIERNRANDEKAVRELNAEGWRCMTVWECALRGRPQEALDAVADRVAHWLLQGRGNDEITAGTGHA